MFDDSESAHNGFPQGSDGVATLEKRQGTIAATGDQLAVANALYSEQPVGALVYVCSPTAAPINITISDLSNDSAAIRSAITTNLTTFFKSSAVTPLGANITLAQITSAIQQAIGSGTFNLVLPASFPITAQVGTLPTLGTVSFA